SPGTECNARSGCSRHIPPSPTTRIDLSQHWKACAAVDRMWQAKRLTSRDSSQYSKPGAAVDRGPLDPPVILRSFTGTCERLLSAPQNDPRGPKVLVANHAARGAGYEKIRRVFGQFPAVRTLACRVASAHREQIATQPLDHLQKLIACRELAVLALAA